MSLNVIRSVFIKEFVGYFSSPVGYIFITLFVFMSGVAAFWTEAFFSRNLANLDQLNLYFPVLLLLLIPAITMSSWAEERRAGTDELLLTLPARNRDLLIGKYLGCLGIYTVCLVFAASHIIVLAFLGKPDIGLMLSTYLGYWLAGVALCGVGLCASVLTASPTVSFILTALACGSFIAIGLLGDIMPAAVAPGVNAPTGSTFSTSAADVLRQLSLPARVQSLGRGVIDPADVMYFLAIGALSLWLATHIVAARRGAPAGNAVHLPLRAAALVVLAVCGMTLLARTTLRADATSERLWSISDQTRDLISKVDPARPIIIQAFVSSSVPPALVQQRETLLGMMRELESLGRGRIATQITVTDANTQQARDAERAFGIRPRAQMFEQRSGGSVQEVFLGVAVTGAGAEPVVLPFLAQALPVEYELARAIRGASQQNRKTIGILDTEAGLFGRFDFQSMRPTPDWPIITELRRQYNVTRVASGAEVPKEIDVLIVAQPSTLNPLEFEAMLSYIKAGRPAMLFEDPMPLVKPDMATNEPRRQANPMMGGDPRASQPKADLTPLWEVLGARLVSDSVAWDTYNPHPEMSQTPGEFMWLNRAAPWAKLTPPISDESAITSGLQEVVMLFAGRIERLPAKPQPQASASAPAADGNAAANAGGPSVTALLRSGPASGQMAYAQILQRSMFGAGLNEARRPTLTRTSQVLAAMITGKSGESNLNVLLAGDLDMISPTFFDLREQGSGALGLEFDNVTFVLNAVDVLASDSSLLELRKKRRAYRTLERLEQQRQTELAAAVDAQEAAKAEAEVKLTEAQARVEKEVKQVQDRTDLDENAKRVMMETVRRTEQRRLDSQAKLIEDQKAEQLEDIRLQTRATTERIQSAVRIAAVALPPIPAILIGLAVMVRRRNREAESGRRERF